MNKFNQFYKKIINEDESLDQWNAQKIKEEEQHSNKHEFDTLSHSLKDRMMGMFKTWIKEGEHQDGEAFWDNFSEPQDAVEDFLKFVEFKNPKI